MKQEDQLQPDENVEEPGPNRDDGTKSLGERIIETLRGSANLKMTTDEIMAMTRGED
jgi:hypothetical protein